MSWSSWAKMGTSVRFTARRRSPPASQTCVSFVISAPPSTALSASGNVLTGRYMARNSRRQHEVIDAGRSPLAVVPAS
eukprot:3932259-Rhodomonas_salina.1